MTAAPDRILVTGASGFVGRHLTASLARAYPGSAVLSPEIDICNATAVDALIHAARPDVCVHLAAISAIAAAQQDPDHAWRVNLHGTLHLARAILQHVPACQMLFVSSADAYGDSFRIHGKVDEGAPLAPTNAYSATKAAADLAVGSMVADGLRSVRLRPFNHTGPGQTPRFVVAAFARQLIRIGAGLQAPVIEVGNLDTERDFVDVRDVCAAYIACIDRRDVLAPGTILNLASGEPRRIGDILEDLQAIAGVRPEVRVAHSRVRATDLHTACGDATRALNLLGWTPTTPWAQTLHDVVNYWRGEDCR